MEDLFSGFQQVDNLLFLFLFLDNLLFHYMMLSINNAQVIHNTNNPDQKLTLLEFQTLLYALPSPIPCIVVQTNNV
jgi:hypothetical protein